MIDCANCGAQMRRYQPATRARTGLFAFGALLLFVPAMIYPMVSVQYLGNYNQFNMVGAVERLFGLHHYFLAVFIGVITMLAPMVQILGWCFLGMAGNSRRWKGASRIAHRAIEVAAPWNMHEMFLVALLVGIIKFGHAASVQTGSGTLAFALVVAFTKSAAVNFDTESDWEARDS